MRKGFTLIELLVCIAIGAVLLTTIFLTIRGGGGERKETPCERYGNYQINHIPARCAAYFKINENTN